MENGFEEDRLKDRGISWEHHRNASENQSSHKGNGTKDGSRKLKEVIACWDHSPESSDRIDVAAEAEEDLRMSQGFWLEQLGGG